ncbi:hypothetical protein [Paraburkholderia sacchari]|uniref:hypothetical protein n=1 Tax=Paraburkholderia sacchari TaxID=159450 RepID=UPI0039A41F9A
MPDADWTNYVGTATGLIALAVSIGAYRRSNQIKSLDMRIELRKVIGESHDSLNNLRSLIDYAAGSRRAVLAARGQGRSGAMQVWEQTLTTDRAEIERIAAALRSEDADFAALSQARLETELVAAYKLKTGLTNLVDKYRGEVTADNDARRQISEQVTAITAARIQAARQPPR